MNIEGLESLKEILTDKQIEEWIKYCGQPVWQQIRVSPTWIVVFLRNISIDIRIIRKILSKEYE